MPLLLGQLVQPSNGFRCPVCGFAFAPGYATVAPGVAARVMVAQAVLVAALAELGSMTGERLRLDRATVVDPSRQHPPTGRDQAIRSGPPASCLLVARGAAPQPTPTVSH